MLVGTFVFNPPVFPTIAGNALSLGLWLRRWEGGHNAGPWQKGLYSPSWYNWEVELSPVCGWERWGGSQNCPKGSLPHSDHTKVEDTRQQNYITSRELQRDFWHSSSHLAGGVRSAIPPGHGASSPAHGPVGVGYSTGTTQDQGTHLSHKRGMHKGDPLLGWGVIFWPPQLGGHSPG